MTPNSSKCHHVGYGSSLRLSYRFDPSQIMAQVFVERVKHTNNGTDEIVDFLDQDVV